MGVLKNVRFDLVFSGLLRWLGHATPTLFITSHFVYVCADGAFPNSCCRVVAIAWGGGSTPKSEGFFKARQVLTSVVF
jgi:hypothetical protein